MDDSGLSGRKVGTPMKKISEVLALIEQKVPLGTAEKWDNVGLLCGNPEWTTEGAVVSVDLTRAAIETAIKKKFSLVLNHHPCIFPKGAGLSRLIQCEDTDDLQSLIAEAMRNGI